MGLGPGPSFNGELLGWERESGSGQGSGQQGIRLGGEAEGGQYVQAWL